MTLDGRQPFKDEDLGWKTTLDGRRPWMEDDLRWKTTLTTVELEEGYYGT